MTWKRTKSLWRSVSGEYRLFFVRARLTCSRDYAATYWPNKGIRGSELQTIHAKIVASDKTLAGEASPDNEANNVDHRANGSYNTSPPAH